MSIFEFSTLKLVFMFYCFISMYSPSFTSVYCMIIVVFRMFVLLDTTFYFYKLSYNDFSFYFLSFIIPF